MAQNAQMTSGDITTRAQQQTLQQAVQQGQVGQSGSAHAGGVKPPIERQLADTHLLGYCEEGDNYDL